MVRSPGDLRQPLANALQHDYGFIIMKGHHSLSSQDVMLYFMQLVKQLKKFTTQEVGLFVHLQGYLVDYKLTDQHGTPLSGRGRSSFFKINLSKVKKFRIFKTGLSKPGKAKILKISHNKAKKFNISKFGSPSPGKSRDFFK